MAPAIRATARLGQWRAPTVSQRRPNASLARRSQVRARRGLKLAVQAAGKNVHRPAIGVIGWISDELIIRSDGKVLVDREGVIRLQNSFRLIIEPAVADQETEAASREEVAVAAGEAVDGAAEPDRIA